MALQRIQKGIPSLTSFLMHHFLMLSMILPNSYIFLEDLSWNQIMAFLWLNYSPNFNYNKTKESKMTNIRQSSIWRVEITINCSIVEKNELTSFIKTSMKPINSLYWKISLEYRNRSLIVSIADFEYLIIYC